MSSWITGLADKAETILNKIDQNAATALHIDAAQVSLDTMKKSLTVSTQSLRPTNSPAKRNSTPMSIGANSASSAKSEGGNAVTTELIKKLPTSNSFSTTPESYSNNMDTHELAAFKIALSEISAERDELRLHLNELKNDTEHFALQQRAGELEILVQSLSEERDKAVYALNETQTAQMAYVHSISELETNLAKLQQEYMSTVQKLQMQTKETEQHRQDLQEYRAKAQRALQSKDALIAELKANPAECGDYKLAAKDSETRFFQVEHDSLKEELQQALDEQQKQRLQLDDFITLEKQRQLELATARQREETLSKELRSARKHNVAIEAEHRMLSQELASLRQQMSNHMAAASTRLQEKEQQLQQFRQEQNFGYGDVNVKNDYENRLKALTQSLVERQSHVERITAERNALRLQYENTKRQLQVQQTLHLGEIESQRGSGRNALLSNTTDDVKAQFPLLMHPSPFDNRVARRVKRAYSSLDSAGIRLGAFLRRYPLMRISVIVYVALLHLWVMFVLLSTTPN